MATYSHCYPLKCTPALRDCVAMTGLPCSPENLRLVQVVGSQGCVSRHQDLGETIMCRPLSQIGTPRPKGTKVEQVLTPRQQPQRRGLRASKQFTTYSILFMHFVQFSPEWNMTLSYSFPSTPEHAFRKDLIRLNVVF